MQLWTANGYIPLPVSRNPVAITENRHGENTAVYSEFDDHAVETLCSVMTH